MTTDEIAARNAARTQGEWKFYPPNLGEFDEPHALATDEKHVIYLNDRYDGYAECGEDLRMDISKADRDFITNAPADISFLLAENQRLREALRPFADRYKQVRVLQSHTPSQVWYEHFAINELRAAHDALEGKG